MTGQATNKPARRLNLTSAHDWLNNHTRLGGLFEMFSLGSLFGSLLGHYSSKQTQIQVITRKLETRKTPIKTGTREQVGTYAKTLPISAKPLFIGSIPIAASKTCSTIASQKPKLPTSWLFHAYVCCRTDSMRFQW